MRRILLIGGLASLALVALQAAAQAIDFGTYNLTLYALNSDKRASVFGVASLLAQGLVGLVALWRARAQRRSRVAWLALGTIVLGLVIVRGLTAFSAGLLAVPLAGVFVLVVGLTWRDPPVARTVVWAALALMAVSLALHKVGLAADDSTASDYTWAYQATGMVKHGCEMAGWMLLATGVLAGAPHVRRHATGDPLSPVADRPRAVAESAS